MYQIHGTSISSNTKKTVYVAEALGLPYELTELALQKGEHKTPEHLQRHPLGKLPTLTHEGNTLFESGAICRYMASRFGEGSSDLYPIDNHFKRSQIDQWMDFFTIHLGRWINAYSFEKYARQKFGLGEPKEDVMKEAIGFVEEQLPALENALEKTGFLVGNGLTIADLFSFAYMENAIAADIPLNKFPNTTAWLGRIQNLDAVKRAQETFNS